MIEYQVFITDEYGNTQEYFSHSTMQGLEAFVAGFKRATRYITSGLIFEYHYSQKTVEDENV